MGRPLAGHLVERGWQVIAVSRKPLPAGAMRQIAVDLADARETRARLGDCARVTHVFYAARHDHPEGVAESEAINTAMLRNLLDALGGGTRLSHVNLVHGTKHYGHPSPIASPVTEDSPRGAAANFYHAQEDLVRERSAGEGWTWSIARPHILCDSQTDHPRSIGLVIAVLAAIQRELGEPLFFPGTERAFAARTQFTDLALLVRAIEWMATESRCAGQAFNIVNGDYPRWDELWPDLARMLGVAAGGPRPVRLARYLADKAAVWDALVARHALRRTDLDRVALWDYGDYVFRPEWDIMSAMDKARRFGFRDRVDTREMFARIFADYRARRVIPR